MTEFRVTRRIELEYQRAIRNLMVKHIPVRRPEQTLEQWLEQLAEISQMRDVSDAAAHLASQMARWINVGNLRTWREASARSQRPSMLHRLLQRELGGPVGTTVSQIVKENAAYISSLPRTIAEQLTGEIARAQQAGARAETISKMMRLRFPALTRSRIQLIARTETQKASSALTQARSEELGLNWYQWSTSEDQRVRPSHRNLDNVLCAWDDPPSPEKLIGERSSLGAYSVAQSPNCRCSPLVVMTLDDVTWPCRVHNHGRVAYMSRAAFSNLSGMKERRAA